MSEKEQEKAMALYLAEYYATGWKMLQEINDGEKCRVSAHEWAAANWESYIPDAKAALKRILSQPPDGWMERLTKRLYQETLGPKESTILAIIREEFGGKQ